MLDKILGNSTQVENNQASEELRNILVPGEQIQGAYRVIRDMFVFTDKRLILLDKLGLTGSKVNITSIPYKSISLFSVETTGTLDRDSELNIWIKGMGMPIVKQFKKGELIFQVQQELVNRTCL